MGGNKKEVNKQLAQNQSYQTQFENEQKQRSGEAYNRANEAYGGANQLYQDFAKGGGQNLLDQAYAFNRINWWFWWWEWRWSRWWTIG